MRIPLAAMMLVLLSVAQVRSEDARSFAKRFYHAHREWGIRGVPCSLDMQRVSPYLSDAILSCFRQVNVQRGMWFREFNRKRIDYPQAWAPEGDVFCSTYEGITCFSIGRVEEI